MLSAAKFSTLARNQSRALTLAPSTPHLSRPRRAPKPWWGRVPSASTWPGVPSAWPGRRVTLDQGQSEAAVAREGGPGRWTEAQSGGAHQACGAGGGRAGSGRLESSLAESAFLPGPGSWVSTRGTPAKSQRGSWKMTLRCVAAPGFSVNLHKTDGAGIPAGLRTEREFRNVRPEGP